MTGAERARRAAVRDDLKDPNRGQIDDPIRQVRQPLAAPAGEVVSRAFRGLVRNTNLRNDPPTTQTWAAGEGAESGIGHNRFAEPLTAVPGFC
jgi:hypothetical protein